MRQHSSPPMSLLHLVQGPEVVGVDRHVGACRLAVRRAFRDRAVGSGRPNPLTVEGDPIEALPAPHRREVIARKRMMANSRSTAAPTMGTRLKRQRLHRRWSGRNHGRSGRLRDCSSCSVRLLRPRSSEGQSARVRAAHGSGEAAFIRSWSALRRSERAAIRQLGSSTRRLRGGDAIAKTANQRMTDRYRGLPLKPPLAASDPPFPGPAHQ
jgi:hypothetical protein